MKVSSLTHFLVFMIAINAILVLKVNSDYTPLLSSLETLLSFITLYWYCYQFMRTRNFLCYIRYKEP